MVIPKEIRRTLRIRDRWQEMPSDTPFYSSAFTRGIFGRGKTGNPKKAAGNITLRVVLPTLRPDETLAVAAIVVTIMARRTWAFLAGGIVLFATLGYIGSAAHSFFARRYAKTPYLSRAVAIAYASGIVLQFIFHILVPGDMPNQIVLVLSTLAVVTLLHAIAETKAPDGAAWQDLSTMGTVSTPATRETAVRLAVAIFCLTGIFAALNSARVMLAVGTDYEYYNAPWVKNEWSRYLQLIAAGQKKSLIPCYKNIDAHDMPKEFAKLQAQDLGKIGATQDLLRGIDKLLGRTAAPAPAPQPQTADPKAPLLKRAGMYLADGDFASARQYANRVLDLDPEEPHAYMYLLLAELKIKTVNEEALVSAPRPLETYPDYCKACRFAAGSYKQTLDELRMKQKKLLYTRAVSDQPMAESENDMIALAARFDALGDYVDSKSRSSALMLKVSSLREERKKKQQEEQRRQEEAAARLGKSQSSIANKLRLLRLGEEERHIITEAKLTERHARALLRLEKEEERLAALKVVAERGMNVAQTEHYIEQLLGTPDKPQKPRRRVVVRDVRIFMNTIHHAVDVMKQNGIKAQSWKRETDQYLEYVVRIPTAGQALFAAPGGDGK